MPDVPLSAPIIRAAVRTLEEMAIVNEMTGQRRHRVVAYQAYLASSAKGAAAVRLPTVPTLYPTRDASQ